MKQVFAKINLLLFFLIFAGANIVAQQNITMEPVEETTDQDAKNFPKLDPINKLPMALIKVQAPATMACAGFTSFDFGSIGPGIIECKDGMTWVYAPKGASKVSIHHNTTGSEYNLELGAQLQGGVVYIMRLKPVRQIRIIEEDAVTQQFLVAQCDMEGATIDIQNYGREAFVNGVFTKMLPFGEYAYQVDAPRYLSDRGKFTIKPDGKTTLTIRLQANFAGVTLTGDGDIYVNDQLKGNNRWTGELTKGQYRVEARKASHRSSARTIEVEPGKPLNLQLDPPAPIYGKLQIACNTIADILVDGINANETTPAILNNVLIGEHKITIRAAGYEETSRPVTINEGKIAQLNIELNKAEIRKEEKPAFNDGIEMVHVSGGTFTMGCTSEQGGDCESDEKPAHQVTLSAYYIGKYEVTQAQWKAVMSNNPSSFKGDNLPVEQVSWNDIQTFIKKLNEKTGANYRLPTEAEWEYAARGGNQSRGYKYSGSNTAGDVAWYGSHSGKQTHPAGQKQANELGIYDMSGNVWEWCSDWYGPYSSSAQTDPRGASSGSYRVARGGGWLGYATIARVSLRAGNNPGDRYYFVGLRLASSP